MFLFTCLYLIFNLYQKNEEEVQEDRGGGDGEGINAKGNSLKIFFPEQLYPYYFFLNLSAGNRSSSGTSKRKSSSILPGKFCFLLFDSLSLTLPFLDPPVDSGSESESGEQRQLHGTSLSLILFD